MINITEPDLKKVLEKIKDDPEALLELIEHLNIAEDNKNLAEALCIILDNLVQAGHLDIKISEIMKPWLRNSI